MLKKSAFCLILAALIPFILALSPFSPKDQEIFRKQGWSLSRQELGHDIKEARKHVFIPVTQYTHLEPFYKEDRQLWLKQEFRISRKFDGRDMVLLIDHPLSSGNIFLNGQPLGRMERGIPLEIPVEFDKFLPQRYNTLILALEGNGGLYGRVQLKPAPLFPLIRHSGRILYWGFPALAVLLALTGLIAALVSLLRGGEVLAGISQILYFLFFLSFGYISFAPFVAFFVPSFPVWTLIPLYQWQLDLYLPTLMFMIVVLFVTRGRGAVPFGFAVLGGVVLYFWASGGLLEAFRIPPSWPVFDHQHGSLAFRSLTLLYCLITALFQTLSRRKNSLVLYFMAVIYGALMVPDVISFLNYTVVCYPFSLYGGSLAAVMLVFFRGRKRSVSVSIPEISIALEELEEEESDIRQTPPVEPVESEIVEAPKDQSVDVLAESEQISELNSSLLGDLMGDFSSSRICRDDHWDMALYGEKQGDFSSYFFDVYTNADGKIVGGCLLDLGREDQVGGLIAVTLKAMLKEMFLNGESPSRIIRAIDSHLARALAGHHLDKRPAVCGSLFRLYSGEMEITPFGAMPLLYRNGLSGKVTVVRFSGDSLKGIGAGLSGERSIRSARIPVTPGDQMLLLHPSVLQKTTLSGFTAAFRSVNFRDVASLRRSLVTELLQGAGESCFIALQG